MRCQAQKSHSLTYKKYLSVYPRNILTNDFPAVVDMGHRGNRATHMLRFLPSVIASPKTTHHLNIAPVEKAGIPRKRHTAVISVFSRCAASCASSS